MRISNFNIDLVPHSGPGPGGPTAGPNHYHLSGAIYFFHMGVRTNFFYHWKEDFKGYNHWPIL